MSRAKAPSLWRQLAASPNAMGFAHGLRQTGGRLLADTALLVFVRRKLPLRALPQRERVPKQIRIGNRALATDVVALGAVSSHAIAVALTDQVTHSTLTCLARDGDGNHYGVSCAHALVGPDRNLQTVDPIQIWNPGVNGWLPGGFSSVSSHDRGKGQFPHFGFTDAGLFRLDDPAWQSAAQSGSVLPLVPTPRNRSEADQLVGSSVAAVGLKTPNAQGIVAAVGCQFPNLQTPYADLYITHPDNQGIAERGDSGMLWCLPDGRGLGIHALGRNEPSAKSPFSFAMFASRARHLLSPGLEFVMAPS